MVGEKALQSAAEAKSLCLILVLETWGDSSLTTAVP